MTQHREPDLLGAFSLGSLLGLLILFLALMLGAWGCAPSLATKVERSLAYDATYIQTEGGNPNTLKFLEQRAGWLDIGVTYVPEGDDKLMGATGLSWQSAEDGKQVVVASTLSVNGRLEVLAHELAHLFQPKMADRQAYEVFAEFTAVEICRRLGVDSSASSARYLAAHKNYLYLGQVYKNEIDYVATILTMGFKPTKQQKDTHN